MMKTHFEKFTNEARRIRLAVQNHYLHRRKPGEIVVPIDCRWFGMTHHQVMANIGNRVDDGILPEPSCYVSQRAALWSIWFVRGAQPTKRDWSNRSLIDPVLSEGVYSTFYPPAGVQSFCGPPNDPEYYSNIALKIYAMTDERFRLIEHTFDELCAILQQNKRVSWMLNK